MMNKKWLVAVVALSLFLEACMASKAANNDFIETVQEASTSGWVGDDETHTWTLASTVTTADADVYVVNVDADVTGYIGANMKVRLEDGGVVKYFGVLQVGAYSAGVTPVYLFGGTDYVLSGTISEFSYSSARAPFGFPMSADKWKIEIVDSNSYTQSSPTFEVAYNLGGLSITIPKGLWNIDYFVLLKSINSISAETWAALSTSSSAFADPTTGQTLTQIHYIGSTYLANTAHGSAVQDLSSETTFYLIMQTISTVTTEITFHGSLNPTVIRAVWGGL